MVRNLLTALVDINHFYEEGGGGFGGVSWIKA